MPPISSYPEHDTSGSEYAMHARQGLHASQRDATPPPRRARIPLLLTQPVALGRPVLPRRSPHSDLSLRRRDSEAWGMTSHQSRDGRQQLTTAAPKAAATMICPRTGELPIPPCPDTARSLARGSIRQLHVTRAAFEQPGIACSSEQDPQ
jgi:hypothetical protein